jgi:hypothetical protein
MISNSDYYLYFTLNFLKHYRIFGFLIHFVCKANHFFSPPFLILFLGKMSLTSLFSSFLILSLDYVKNHLRLSYPHPLNFSRCCPDHITSFQILAFNQFFWNLLLNYLHFCFHYSFSWRSESPQSQLHC